MRDEELDALKDGIEPPDPVAEVVSHIHSGIHAAYDGEPPEFHIDELVIRTALKICFFTSAGSWLYMLGPDGVPVRFSGTDAIQQLRLRTPRLVSNVDPAPANAPQRKAVYDLPTIHLFNAIKWHNQRQTIQQRTDMFATTGAVSLAHPIAAETIYTHRELVADNEWADAEVVADYKEHFPEFDDVLDAITAAKFAPDRKEAYLWLHCVSDWGKGFLIGIFRELGIVTEVSVSEAEKAFTGSPVGLSELEFYNSFLLAFDEFKNVKAELKQLQNYIMLSPKHQLRVECQLYFKIFFSKEAVHSLAGDRGIDDQFANRFALIRGKSTITSRDVFNAKGKGHYLKAVAHYAAARINKRVEEYRAVGKCNAERRASEVLTWFHESYGIDKHYERSSVSLQEIAEDFGAWLAHPHEPDKAMDKKEHVLLRENVFEGEGGNYYLKSPSSTFSHWLKNRADPSELAKVGMARDEIIHHLSADGEGNKMRQVAKGRKLRAVLLKRAYQAATGERYAFGKF